MSQKYDKEFKIQTVKMIQEQGKPVAQAARELGVSDNTLYRWINEFKQDPVNAFRGSGNLLSVHGLQAVRWFQFLIGTIRTIQFDSTVALSLRSSFNSL